MENKLMRFLSLLLALVMVVGMMPVGKVHAAAVIVPEAKVLSDNRVVSLADCEYTFTRSGDYWQITGTTADGETVYVNPCATDNAVIPQSRTEITDLRLYTGVTGGSMHISGSKGSLHFHNGQASPWWNKCGSNANNKADADHDVYFFKRSAVAATNSVIPGYEQVNELNAVVEGKYLIAAVNNDGNWFVMHPSVLDGTDDTKKKDHIAQVVIQMNVGDTYTITNEGVRLGSYGNETVALNANYTITPVSQLGAPVTAIEDGWYLIVNKRAKKAMSNQSASQNAEAGAMSGRSLNGTINDTTTEYRNVNIWNITKSGEQYIIKDVQGNCLNITSNDAKLQKDEVAFNIDYNAEGSYWSIGSGNIWLNDAAGKGVCASGWNSVSAKNDAGSQWTLYRVDVLTTSANAVNKLVAGKSYVIANTSTNHNNYVLNTAGNDATWLSVSNSMSPTNFDSSAIWTLGEDSDNTSAFTGKVKAASGECLNFSGSGSGLLAADQAANVTILQNDNSKADNTWRIACNNCYLNPQGGLAKTWGGPNSGHHDDQGNHWYFYEVITAGSTEFTFTALQSGNTEITIDGTTYCFHVHNWAEATCSATCSCGAVKGTDLPHTPGAPIYTKAETGYTKTVSCSVCGMVTSTENVDKFGISYANIAMENSLEVCFAFGMSLMGAEEWKDCYAVIKHQYAGGSKTDTQKVEFADWIPRTINDDNYYSVTFKGVAAKEMADEFQVTIYDANDTPISQTYIDSIEAYALRVLNGNGSDNYKRVVVDMLNYGAEAQKAFKYNKDHLANSGLSAEQLALGTSDAVEFDESLNTDACPVDYKANVKLESKLQFLMAFTGINETMSAKVTFTDWNGKEKTKPVPGEKFVDAGTFHYLAIEDLVVADGRQDITCTIYDANGKQVAQVTDSLASYAGRTTTNRGLYEAIVKFSDSAKVYLKNK